MNRTMNALLNYERHMNSTTPEQILKMTDYCKNVTSFVCELVLFFEDVLIKIDSHLHSSTP